MCVIVYIYNLLYIVENTNTHYSKTLNSEKCEGHLAKGSKVASKQAGSKAQPNGWYTISGWSAHVTIPTLWANAALVYMQLHDHRETLVARRILACVMTREFRREDRPAQSAAIADRRSEKLLTTEWKIQ